MPKNITVLLIDDDEILIEMYGKKFKLANFNILITHNGLEGFDLAIANKPDLILSDLVMPKGDGFELLKKLKKDERTKNIPVIVLTNLSSNEDKKETLSRGAIDYCVKSELTPAQMVEKAKKVLKIK